MSWSGLPAYLENKIIPEPNTGCWMWVGVRYVTTGYGKTVKTKNNKSSYLLVHRVVYEHLKEKIPENLEIDHLCRNRWCCNPDHLEAVTRQVNGLRGQSVPAINARKTHCKNGHELVAPNIYPNSKKRRCITCSRIGNAARNKLWRQKHARSS